MAEQQKTTPGWFFAAPHLYIQYSKPVDACASMLLFVILDGRGTISNNKTNLKPETKFEKSYSTLSLIKVLFAAIGPYKWRFLIASVMRIVGEVIWLYPAYALALIAQFFTQYKQGQSLEPFWNIMALFALASVIYFITSYYASLWGFGIAKRISINTELKAIQHAFSLDIDWHEKENTGNRVKRIDRGGEGINQILRMWFSAFIEIGVNIFGVIFVVSRFDLPITLATVVFLIAYFVASFIFTRKAVKVHRQENLKEEEVSGLTFESMNNVRSAKVMSMTRALMTKLSSMSEDLFSIAQKRLFWYQSGGATKNLMAQIFRVAALCYIGWGITQGRYDLAFFVLFYTYFSRIQSAVSRLAETSQDFVVRKQAVGRMTELFEVRPVTDIEDGKVPFPKDWQKIEIRNVTFSYGDKKVLDDVSFTILRGEKIGLVGLSGAGKSTLFKLLLKERESYEGEILIDGISLRSISKSDYFTRTAVVLQETEVFNFSLRENVAISNFVRMNDGVLFERALSVAHVADFARSLPQGVDTLIGEKGIKLSGGEKQRVGMARAVFKDPELLLLDEATSHLDVESEEKIQDSLRQFFQTVTAVVIAHRLTTIKEMDKILVLEGGKIVEQGSFAELYDKQGRFYTLWEKQKL